VYKNRQPIIFLERITIMADLIIYAVLFFAVYLIFTRTPCCKNKRGSLGKLTASDIPQHEIDTLARCLLPAMNEFFETEEGQRKFEEWKAAQSVREGLMAERKAG
jgi:hypothetical protein